MKFSCDRINLMDSLQTVSRALGARSTMPVLEGIYLEAEENQIKLLCSDNTIAIQTYVPAIVEQEGRCLLPGKLLHEIIRKCVDGEITFALGDQMEIKSGRSKTKLSPLDVTQYPPMPVFSSEHTIAMENGKLKSMIRGTIFAADDEASAIKPVLTGVYCQFLGDEMKMVALDGRRLAIRKESLSCGEGSAIIPSRSLEELSKILDNDEETCTFSLSSTYVQVEYEKTTIVVRVLDGEYFHYEKILPDGYKIRVKGKREEIYQAIDRASLMAREGKENLLKLTVDQETLIITSNSQVGEAYEEVQIWEEGGPIKIAFNAKYLADALKNIEDEYIYLDFHTNVTPCMIRPCEHDRFLYLILPVRTND